MGTKFKVPMGCPNERIPRQLDTWVWSSGEVWVVNSVLGTQVVVKGQNSYEEDQGWNPGKSCKGDLRRIRSGTQRWSISLKHPERLVKLGTRSYFLKRVEKIRTLKCPPTRDSFPGYTVGWKNTQNVYVVFLCNMWHIHFLICTLTCSGIISQG